MMLHEDIVRWLREEDPDRLQELWQLADEARRCNVGDEVYLRGLIEFSNYCARQCGYCGLRAHNREVVRYRMTADEVWACVQLALRFGYGTIVLQSGEDFGISADWIADVVARIKSETPLAVTLSLGERSDDDLRLWREAGADRYLLRFETSNPVLFDRIHPPLGEHRIDRVAMLGALRDLGYEVGSGVLIGIPGQTFDDLARDVGLFHKLALDMVGVGPFIPHPATPLGAADTASGSSQVPNTELMTYKVLALTRLACPKANIPSTTALATVNKAEGRELGLMRGANIVMPNLTPPKYRTLYEIYPGKACVNETAEACSGCLRNRIESIGRRVGAGRGDSRSFHEKASHRDAPVEAVGG